MAILYQKSRVYGPAGVYITYKLMPLYVMQTPLVQIYFMLVATVITVWEPMHQQDQGGIVIPPSQHFRLTSATLLLAGQQMSGPA
jgi:hypothetical protein